MLPRTIDKLRAKLPGGNIGVYKIDGFSTRMMDAIGVTEEQLQAAVARAQNDEDVVAWLRENANTGRYAETTKQLRERNITMLEDRAGFEKRYPIVTKRPDLYYLMDILDADDEELFGRAAR